MVRCIPHAPSGLDGEIGGLGGGRRADPVLLDDELKVRNTWYGGELVVEDGAITPVLDAALSRRYQYPKAAYATVKVPHAPRLALRSSDRTMHRQYHSHRAARHHAVP